MFNSIFLFGPFIHHTHVDILANYEKHLVLHKETQFSYFKQLNLFTGEKNLRELSEKFHTINALNRHLIDHNGIFDPSFFEHEVKLFKISEKNLNFLQKYLFIFQEAFIERHKAFSPFLENERFKFNGDSLYGRKVRFDAFNYNNFINEEGIGNALALHESRTLMESIFHRKYISAVEVGYEFYFKENPKGLLFNKGNNGLVRFEKDSLGHSRLPEIQTFLIKYLLNETSITDWQRSHAKGIDFINGKEVLEIKNLPWGKKGATSLEDVDKITSFFEVKTFIQKNAFYKDSTVCNELENRVSDKKEVKVNLYINASQYYYLFNNFFSSPVAFAEFLSENCIKNKFDLSQTQSKVFIIVLETTGSYVKYPIN